MQENCKHVKCLWIYSSNQLTALVNDFDFGMFSRLSRIFFECRTVFVNSRAQHLGTQQPIRRSSLVQSKRLLWIFTDLFQISVCLATISPSGTEILRNGWRFRNNAPRKSDRLIKMLMCSAIGEEQNRMCPWEPEQSTREWEVIREKKIIAHQSEDFRDTRNHFCTLWSTAGRDSW